MPWWALLVWSVAFVVMLTIAIGGNSLVCWIILGHQHMRTVTNYFLVNLSVANLLMSTLNCTFNFVYMVNADWPFGLTYCIINNFFANFTVSASVLTLMAVAFERYLVIVHPLRRRIRKCEAISGILLIWISSAGLSTPCLLYSTIVSHRYPSGREVHGCILVWPDGPQMASFTDYVYNMIFLVLTYILPMIAMAVSYTIIGRQLWGAQSIGVRTDRQMTSIKSKRKIVRMFIIVVAMFALSWLPYQVYFVYTYHDTSLAKTSYVQHLFLAFYWLAMSYAMVNPLIYFWMNRRFRSYLVLWCRCALFRRRAGLRQNGRLAGGLCRGADRYLVIVHPLRRRIRKCEAISGILLIWISSAGLSTPCLLYSTIVSHRYPSGREVHGCILVWPDGPQMASFTDYVYNMIFLVLTYILPMIAMAVSYTIIGRQLWGAQSIGVRTDRQMTSIKSKRKIVRMFIIVVAMFALSWLPYQVYFVYTYHDTSLAKTSYVQHLFLAFYWLAMSYAMVNPLIYFWMNRRFRSYLVLWCRCACFVGGLDYAKTVVSRVDSVVVLTAGRQSRRSVRVASGRARSPCSTDSPSLRRLLTSPRPMTSSLAAGRRTDTPVVPPTAAPFKAGAPRPIADAGGASSALARWRCEQSASGAIVDFHGKMAQLLAHGLGEGEPEKRRTSAHVRADGMLRFSPGRQSRRSVRVASGRARSPCSTDSPSLRRLLTSPRPMTSSLAAGRAPAWGGAAGGAGRASATIRLGGEPASADASKESPHGDGGGASSALARWRCEQSASGATVDFHGKMAQLLAHGLGEGEPEKRRTSAHVRADGMLRFSREFLA
ncbi:LOW QUALITY PROTEIN: uncharacterized protein LOC119104768 [Pollicipes pollicipes]|uniref:LOW QUALITY PROTEIN: uncharacterized protein LOC119104768 n=1 Tax=Pollicipes pollicipes TaxID=41117 RepID=UPI0018856966|nr:LOW QUALITY PROTEIN: uncharacterized protein LOC119104768 [Pollicipes pollicipes]